LIQELLSSPMFIVIIGSGFGVILVGVVIFLIPINIKSRIDTFVDIAEEETDREAKLSKNNIESFRARINAALTFLASDTLRLKLLSAHWQVSDREFILIRGLLTILGFVIGWLIPRHIVGGLGLGLVAYSVPSILLSRSLDLRRQRFQEQLMDALVMIRGAIESGYSFLQSLDLVRDEMAKPASEEFGRVIREVQLGLPLNQALRNLAGRMDNDDLSMVVTSIIINSQVGGNLTTMLSAVTETIRSRMFLFGEIRALTSYARYAGYFLTLLPFITGLLIFLLTPTYFNTVPGSLASQILLAAAGLSLIIGNIWIRRIIKINV
jgi:tight adherence protein B